MLNIISKIVIAAILLFAGTQVLLGQSEGVAGDRRIKTQVNKLGAGAKVTVFLKDGTKVRGSISQILDDSFDVTLLNQTQSSIVSYRDVERIKRRGWTNPAKIAIGVGVGVGVAFGAIAIMLAT